MFSRFFKSTLLFLLIFNLYAHGTTVDLRHVPYNKHLTKPPQTTSVSKEIPSTVLDLFTGQSNAAHLTSQNYRLTHLVKLAFILNQIVFASVSCSKYISWESELKFSRFRKLVLFPFHVFW